MLGEQDGISFCAHESVRGENSVQRIAAQGNLAPAKALEAADHIASLMQAAFEAGVVYASLDAAEVQFACAKDIMVTSFDVVPLGDTTYTVHASYLASFSPERLREEALDFTSSVYSLATLLWFLLSGKMPYSGPTAVNATGHLQMAPPFEELPDLPPAVADLLGSMMQKKRELRPESPAALRHAIQAVKAMVDGSQGGLSNMKSDILFASTPALVLPAFTAARETASQRHPRPFAFAEFLVGTAVAVLMYFFLSRPAPETPPAANEKHDAQAVSVGGMGH
jgi:serine/threonine protein kinase